MKFHPSSKVFINKDPASVGFFYFYTMDIKQFLDSTYLKTAEQAKLSEAENRAVVKRFVEEAIEEQFKLIMIRPDMVEMSKKMILAASSKVLVGTVIDFPLGQSTLESKLEEAAQAVCNGADELDFVVNYEAFKEGEIDKVKTEVLECTRFGLSKQKVVKWIIEVAALEPHQIVQLSVLIKNIVITNFKEDCYASVFVKSSTGFYETKDNLPNGATVPAILLMLENAFPLPVKAAGGVRNYEEAEVMIRLGVKRIGTSAAKAIASGQIASEGY